MNHIKFYVYYIVTSLIVVLGMTFSFLVVPSGLKGHVFRGGDEAYANWDGQWYRKIAAEGYSFDPVTHSTVAFFPAYPVLGGLASRLSGLDPGKSLFLVANISLIFAFMLLCEYAKIRQVILGSPSQLPDYTLLALGLVPTSFFFRMVYSESLFLLVTVAFLYAIERRWPLGVIAVIVGLATACRPVGICLIPPLVLCIRDRSSSRWNFLRNLVLLMPLAFLGIGSYMLYLQLRFGNPIAFAQTQVHWAERPSIPFVEKVVALATLEPVRRLFDPACYAFWGNYEPSVPTLLSMHVADPLFFFASLILVAIGISKRWLSTYESLSALLLILVPYWTSGYETYMRSIGRYCSSAVPIYLVLGQILCRIPGPITAALLSVSGFLLGAYTALFATWHKFY